MYTVYQIEGLTYEIFPYIIRHSGVGGSRKWDQGALPILMLNITGQETSYILYFKYTLHTVFTHSFFSPLLRTPLT